MKWAVVVFPGSNCDEDAVSAITEVTGDGVDKVWHTTRDLSGYDAIVLPGGFSYGDYLRSGAIARFSPVLAGVQEAAAAGKLVLGICNGFQVLTEAGLLPGALLRNDHLQFRCELTPLQVVSNTSAFLSDYEVGEVIQMPIAHGEGRYYADEQTLDELTAAKRVGVRYLRNPNGSLRAIAGVVNGAGNVFGLMPHPERAVAQWMGSSDGRRMFLSMKRFVEDNQVAVQSDGRVDFLATRAEKVGVGQRHGH
ncbi:phosphoribosylformylglycinamidine synthase subunit PurQ [Alicyclobacillaceae bacterium I2511]|nr:phosphoribosylformylglycinamidine synthase subunit PurQ [Alicyclobacillaceae bacterium I2511]